MTGHARREGRKQARLPASTIQGAGRRRLITIRGQTKRLAEWADEFGMSRKTLITRIERDGMTPEEALSKDVRKRADDDRVAERRETLREIVASMQPVTVRQMYYQMSVLHPDMIAATKNGYKMVGNDLCELREGGVTPYESVVDNTRSAIRPYGYNSVADALDELVRSYRRNFWNNMGELVQIWIEKDALAGTLEPITLKYGVPLMVARGYASLSFLHKEAMLLKDETRPINIYHLGDHDPEGRDACRVIEEKLRQMAPKANIWFTPLAVRDEEQIEELGLPKTKVKEKSSRAAKWGDKPCAELDAIPPADLRDMVEAAINLHMSKAALKRLDVEDPELDRVRELSEELRS